MFSSIENLICPTNSKQIRDAGPFQGRTGHSTPQNARVGVLNQQPV